MHHAEADAQQAVHLRYKATRWLWTYNHERPEMAPGGITLAMALNIKMPDQLVIATLSWAASHGSTC